MRLSEWGARAPNREAASTKVMAIIGATIAILGVERDPECWVMWGDDAQARYLIFIPTVSGLVQIIVRVNVPGEGPRASGKVLRWNRVQVGELATEIHSSHRLATFQVESQVINGADTDADAIGVFAGQIFAAIDGRSGDVGQSGSGAGSSANSRRMKPVSRPPATKGSRP